MRDLIEFLLDILQGWAGETFILIPDTSPIPMVIIWVCLKIVYPNQPNGFADHYPYFLWLFVWEYSLFSDKYNILRSLIGMDGHIFHGGSSSIFV